MPPDTLPDRLDQRPVPEGLKGPPAVPRDNPVTAARVELGRRLFFDPVLSADGSMACASCHDPGHGFADPRRVSIGVRGQRGTRNAPSLFNVAYGTRFFWDGRAASLEDQVRFPIENPRELGSKLADVVTRLRRDPRYVKEFAAAFDEGLTTVNLARAIAGFERTLLLGDSAIDRFRGGDSGALTNAQRQGLWLFESRARCWRCHSGGNFTDGRFHNTGVAVLRQPADPGRFAVTRRPADRGAFKTPTLRGVSRTAPYMHDGSLKTLEDVVRFYSKGGGPNPDLDLLIRPLNLSEQEVGQLVEFLRALEGEWGSRSR